MLALVMASMLVASNDPGPVQAKSLKGQPTRYCRELGSAASRNQALIICRTRAQWLERESCLGATRYCPSKKRATLAAENLGPRTAFEMNEDSRIVCRFVKITGTRLASQKACLPQREWERMWKDSAEAMLKLQDTSKRVEGPQ